jgi:uncharacterized membrane protein
MDYVTLKWLHIMSATFLFGTGVGSAFYLLLTTLSRDVRAVALVSRYVVLADWLFTATTAVIQPVSGYVLMRMAGFPVTSTWIAWSFLLYGVAIACWLPVVWLQMRLRDLAGAAAEKNAPLPVEYWRYFRMWVALGIPAFFAFVVVFYLMVAKPA